MIKLLNSIFLRSFHNRLICALGYRAGLSFESDFFELELHFFHLKLGDAGAEDIGIAAVEQLVELLERSVYIVHAESLGDKLPELI